MYRFTFPQALLEIIHHKFNIILVLWQAVRFQTWSFLQLKAFYIQNTDGDGSVVKLVIEGVHPFSTVSLAQQVIDPEGIAAGRPLNARRKRDETQRPVDGV